jgi:hypothetical protein
VVKSFELGTKLLHAPLNLRVSEKDAVEIGMQGGSFFGGHRSAPKKTPGDALATRYRMVARQFALTKAGAKRCLAPRSTGA